MDSSVSGDRSERGLPSPKFHVEDAPFTLEDELRLNLAVECAINVLNEALELEPVAITDLLLHRVSIGPGLATHPSIQCLAAGPDSYKVSALGLINGLFGADENDWGFIYAHVDDSGVITHFSTKPDDE